MSTEIFPELVQHQTETADISSFPNLLSPEEISLQALVALKNKINWAQTPKETEPIPIYPSLDEIDINQAIDLLPKPLDFNKMHQNSWDYLFEIINNPHSDQVIPIILSRIDLNNLGEVDCEGLSIGSKLLHFLIVKGYAEDVINLFPETVDLTTISQDVGQIIAHLISIGLDGEICKRLPESIDIKNTTGSTQSIFNALIEKNLTTEIFKRLPQTIDLSTIGMGAAYLFQDLSFAGYADLLLDRFPKPLDLYNLDSSVCDIFFPKIGFKASPEKLTEYIPQSIDYATLSDYGSGLISGLLKKVDLSYLLPDSIDIYQLSDGASFLLLSFASHGYEEKVFSLINQPINLRYLNSPNFALLTILSRQGYAERLFSMLTLPLDLKEFNTSAKFFFKSFLKIQGYKQRLFNLLASPIDLGIYNKFSVDFLIDSLLDNPEAIRDIARQLEQIRPNLRQPIDCSDIELSSKVGLYLSELIDNFPIIPGSMTILKNGWYRAELDKEGSQSFVFIKINNDSYQIIFRTDGFSEENLATYKKAAKVLPGYVSSPYYPELSEDGSDNQNTQLRYKGYREVFTGPSLTMINYDTLPQPIVDSIRAQYSYIRLMLYVKGIAHSHDHKNNFNVRFLLTSKDGLKKVCFDPNYAIQIAKEQQLSLTPIVTLRDWDLSKSS